MKTFRMAGCTALCLLCATGAWGGVLRMGAPTFQGDQVNVPVFLDGDTGVGVSAVTFHLDYDPAVFEPTSVVVGAAASAADKQVRANMSAPGQYNVVMMGLNTNAISSGEVAAIAFRVVAAPSSGQSALAISETSFASPQGTAVPSQGASMIVTFPESQEEESGTQGNAAQSAEGATENASASQQESRTSTSAFSNPANDVKTLSATPPVQTNAVPLTAEQQGAPGAHGGASVPQQQLTQAIADLEQQRSALTEMAATPAGSGLGAAPEGGSAATLPVPSPDTSLAEVPVGAPPSGSTEISSPLAAHAVVAGDASGPQRSVSSQVDAGSESVSVVADTAPVRREERLAIFVAVGIIVAGLALLAGLRRKLFR
ncbi:MAG TPA: cohesin domain-containing protein [Candidatus Hydrogenedentes bacterium]|nr:cohesin domain-containing protein [Candidatus Hydrogenedentota bacterium]